jgi:hypothetical protein
MTSSARPRCIWLVGTTLSMSGLLDGTSTLQPGPETKRPRTSLWSVSWVAAGRERRCVWFGRVLRVDPAPHRDRPQGAGGPAQEAHRSGDLGVGCDLPGGPDSGQPTVDPPQEHGGSRCRPAGRRSVAACECVQVGAVAKTQFDTGARRPGSCRLEAEDRCSVVMVNRCRCTHHTVRCSTGPLVLSRMNRSVISAGARHCGQLTS